MGLFSARVEKRRLRGKSRKEKICVEPKSMEWRASGPRRKQWVEITQQLPCTVPIEQTGAQR
jgi:hypothetical protein